ncbi:hypothetical protein [Streptomyces sp. NPDC004286]|uniref:hypothetical protein n=1 Tax=Streptomyces sp. NPDC004286 TaxID=3364696 RepID=UPI0036B1B713
MQSLGAKTPLDVEALCESLAKRRGRPLHLRSAPLERPGPSGYWAEYEDYDVILYQQETTRLHQEHIILHEVGHILVAEKELEGSAAWGRVAGAGSMHGGAVTVEDWADLLPVFEPSAIKRVALRCSYENGEECLVELVATIILEWSSVIDSTTPWSQDPQLRRVEAAFGDRRGWL